MVLKHCKHLIDKSLSNFAGKFQKELKLHLFGVRTLNLQHKIRTPILLLNGMVGGGGGGGGVELIEIFRKFQEEKIA